MILIISQFILATAIWTGANSPGQDGKYVFAGDNAAFDYPNVPFGSSKFCLQRQLSKINIV